LYEEARVREPEHMPARPFAAARVHHALGYRPWQPPPSSGVHPRARNAGLLGRMARAAINQRHTVAGRVLFRLAPRPLLAALRARLKT
jgi:hypothetical protein